jgi:hypothetical protein
MALNPIVYTGKVIGSFLRFQLTADPETGERYTVKRYESENVAEVLEALG